MVREADVVQIEIAKDQFYIGADETDGFLYLGVLSPSWFTEEQKRSHCLNGIVPWIHVSLAYVTVPECARVKGRLQESLQAIWNGIPGSHIHLYFEPNGTHDDKSDDDSKCSLSRANCLKGMRALVDVLRAAILTSKPHGGIWQIGRTSHISVLNAICLHWKTFRIGRIQLQEESYELDFSADSTFEKASDSHVLKKKWAKYFLKRCLFKVGLKREEGTGRRPAIRL